MDRLSEDVNRNWSDSFGEEKKEKQPTYLLNLL